MILITNFNLFSNYKKDKFVNLFYFSMRFSLCWKIRDSDVNCRLNVDSSNAYLEYIGFEEKKHRICNAS